jgi:hypothetical protein
VPIDPDRHRIREGAHLHERRPEIVVPGFEVVTGDATLSLGEVEPHTPVVCPVRLVAKNTGATPIVVPIFSMIAGEGIG